MMTLHFRRAISALAIAATAAAGLALAQPAEAQSRQEITNNPAACRGAGPAVRITLNEVKNSSGTIRVQLYRGTEADWLESGRWIYRMETPARAGTMNLCMPVPNAGTYGIAIRHDVNGNGSTDIMSDGGAMSGNPSLNIFNLGKPSYKKTKFDIGNEVLPMTLRMRYM